MDDMARSSTEVSAPSDLGSANSTTAHLGQDSVMVDACARVRQLYEELKSLEGMNDSVDAVSKERVRIIRAMMDSFVQVESIALQRQSSSKFFLFIFFVETK